jgi:fibronectin type 3 domain-containing protein
MWSEASKSTEITLSDVFPPDVPQGLVVAGFPVEGSDTLAADLVWQPDTESDLAGYNVYRQTLAADGSAAGAAGKLNAALVALPSFHDATVARGVTYRYTVTAVDSKGNESAASVAADLAATP